MNNLRGRPVQSTCLMSLVLFLVGATSPAEVPIHSNQPSSDFLKEWLICGPFVLDSTPQPGGDFVHLGGFETDFLEAIGGETAPEIEEGKTFSYKGETCTWIRHKSGEHCVDLDSVLTDRERVAAYAFCVVESTQDQVCFLSLGTNDGGRLWLNGEQIWDRPRPRRLIKDDDFLIVHLKKGWNTLLLKIEERGGSWGFCVRFLPFESGKVVDRFTLFRVSLRDGRIPVLRFLHPVSLVDEVFKRVVLSITRQGEPSRVLWEGEWNREKEFSLPVNTETFGKYFLNIRGTLRDDQEWTREIPFSAGVRTEHVLFEDGKTSYAIVVGKEASESEKWAATELQHWIKTISGVDFPLRSDQRGRVEKEIIVGFNRHAGEVLGSEFQPPDDDDESFVYKSVGSTVLIWGGKDRGTLYGVMAFLENEFGCRWYTPRVTVIPQRNRYVFETLYHTESPGLRVRNDFYFEAFDPTWAARNRVNGAMGFREQPGGVECYWGVHTFYPLMPPSEFFDEHPEYYSLIDGKRTHDRAQLCLTNPDVLLILTERLKEVIRNNPEYLIYSVSQNDWHGPCQCDNCQAIAKQEESEAGPVIWFVNQVAEAVEKEFPDKYVGTLAYQYTRKPCKNIRPRHNVVVRLCSIECCFSHDFLSCPDNASFVEDLKGWSAIAPHLYIWDYVVNFGAYVMPFPNFRVLQPNLQVFRDNKAIGVMEQAAYQSRGGEFAELRAYLIAKLLWNPDLNCNDVIDDFMDGYYGRSGRYIRKYFDLLHDRITPETHVHLWVKPDNKFFTDRFVQEAEKIFDQAEHVADNDEILRRVEMARLPIMYLKCKRTPLVALNDGTYDRFCKIVEREGITHYAERGAPHKRDFHDQMEALREEK